jgi:hypothetical protein
MSALLTELAGQSRREELTVAVMPRERTEPARGSVYGSA